MISSDSSDFEPQVTPPQGPAPALNGALNASLDTASPRPVVSSPCMSVGGRRHGSSMTEKVGHGIEKTWVWKMKHLFFLGLVFVWNCHIVVVLFRHFELVFFASFLEG